MSATLIRKASMVQSGYKTVAYSLDMDRAHTAFLHTVLIWPFDEEITSSFSFLIKEKRLPDLLMKEIGPLKAISFREPRLKSRHGDSRSVYSPTVSIESIRFIAIGIE